MTTIGLSVLDYCIFAASIAVSLGIGIYSALSGGRQKTTAEFLVANRNMKVWPVCVSLLVSFESSIMMLGIPGDAYVYGFDFIICGLSMTIFIFLAAVFTVPLFHNLKVISAYEYLQARFGSRAVRLLGSILGICQCLFYMGIVLYGPATALEAVSGFSTWYSLLVISVAAMIYTSIGGIKAVIWADAFQSFIMVAGLLSVIIMGTISVGGFQEVVRIANEGNRFDLSFSLDPTKRSTFWSLMVAGIRGMRLSLDQTSVQRIATMPTLTKARIIFFAMAPGFFLFILFAIFEGLVAFAYYSKKGCDPLTAGYISNPNQIIPYFVLEIFRDVPGLPGLFMAALFSASLSTLSSGYGSMSAVVWTDFIKPLVPEITELKATTITRVLVIVFGVMSVAIAALVQEIGGTIIWIAITVISVFAAPLVGMFLLGAIFSQANYKGALAGCLTATIVCFWKGMGTSFSGLVSPYPYLQLYTDNCTTANNTATFPTPSRPVHHSGSEEGLAYFYSITSYLLMPMGVLITIVVGLIVSFLTGRNKGPVNSMHLIPVVDMCCCCLPDRLRFKLRVRRQKYTLNQDLMEMKNKSRDQGDIKDGELFNDNDILVSDHNLEDH